jgi:hypothetical protein
MSTFVDSPLKIELIGTGEQVGTWGATTNVNLQALQEAITGSADVAFSSSDVTLTLTNTNGTQTARNLRLVCTGTSGGARNLILGSGCQIDRLYLVQNDLANEVTVKNTTGTGVAIPAGKSKFVFNDGTNVVEAVTAPTNLATGVTGTLAVGNGGTGATTLTGVLKGNGTSAFTASNVNLASEVTGTLPVANGGTGQTTYTDGQLLIGNTTGNTLTKATLTAGTGISITNGTGSITVAAINNGTVTSVGGTGTVQGLTLSGTVTSSGNLTLGGSLSGINLASQVTGTLPIANGGTGATVAATALSNLGGVTQAGARSALSFVAGSGAYNASTGVITIPTNNNQIANGSGFTTNTGTVTSVSGTGSASGLTLSGTVTTSGNLTLSGTVNSLAAGTYNISISGNAATAGEVTNGVYTTDFTGANQSKSTSGFQKLPGGVIIQWGNATVQTGVGAPELNDNFPIAFTTVYSFVASRSSGSTSSDGDFTTAFSNTAYGARYRVSGANTFSWIAIGV